MIILNTLFLLVACHLLGDYVLQVDFIAQSKGKNWYHLFVHCLLYVVPFYIVYGFDLRLCILFIAHMTVDPLKARYNKITYPQDQIIHYLTILVLYFEEFMV